MTNLMLVSFFRKTTKKSEKSIEFVNIRQKQHLSTLLNVFFHMKNPQNSAYLLKMMLK